MHAANRAQQPEQPGPLVRDGAFLSRAFFATTLLTLGILGLVQGRFTPTWSGVPAGFPGRRVLALVCACVSLASGLGLLGKRTAPWASGGLLTLLLVWLIGVRGSHLLTAPTALDAWWGCGDTAVMAAGAWVLYAQLAEDRGGRWSRFAAGPRGLRVARVLYGLAMIPFGVAHFMNLKATAALVPGWLPWPAGLAAFTGVAFLAAGLAVLTGILARLGATLSAAQMGAFTLVVWAPVVLGGANAFQGSEFLDSWALAAGAWVVAASYRGRPWFTAPVSG